jgi:hypothetical protein
MPLQVEQIVLPAAFMPFLIWAFDKLKPYLGKLGWFSQSNPSHAKNLRELLFVICAVAVLIFCLATGMMPHSFDAGVELLQRILATAGLMTASGHVIYDQVSGNAKAKREAVYAPVDDPDLIYPPSDYDGGAELRTPAAPQPALSAEPPAE